MSGKVKVSVDDGQVKKLFADEDMASLAKYFKDTLTIVKDEEGAPLKFDIDPAELVEMCQCFSEIFKYYVCDPDIEVKLIDILTAFRNCALTPEIQNAIAENINFMTDIRLLYETCRGGHKFKQDTVFKMLLQFLVNLIVSNELSSNVVYNLLHIDILNKPIEREECLYEQSALLYNLYLNVKNFNITAVVTEKVVRLVEIDGNEFSQFLLEKILKEDEPWAYYGKLTLKQRMIILETIRERQLENNSIDVTENCVVILGNHFYGYFEEMLVLLIQDPADEQAYEVGLTLEVLAALSACHRHCRLFKHAVWLFVRCTTVLYNVNLVGKHSENCFTVIQKLSRLKCDVRDLKEHPAYGFKLNLIRLLGNMSYQNKKMQDLAREADLIPLLMDCCTLDARNPYIIQWVVLAIRNLCENNLENQQFIAEMRQQGEISSETLETLGFTLDSDGEKKIKIIPLDSLKK